MDNPRPEKVAVVDEVRERFESAEAALLTEYRGLDVAAMAELRRALRAAGGEYKIYKNTLVRFAARDLGLEIEDLLTGPTAIAFVDGDAGRTWPRRSATSPGPTRPWWSRAACSATRCSTAAERRALADVAAPRGAAGPAGRRAWPRRCSSSPACSRPCPATSPTGCRPSSTQGGVPGAPAGRRRACRSRGAPGAEADPSPRPRPQPPRPRRPRPHRRRRRAPHTETPAADRPTPRRRAEPWPPRKRSSTPSPA